MRQDLNCGSSTETRDQWTKSLVFHLDNCVQLRPHCSSQVLSEHLTCESLVGAAFNRKTTGKALDWVRAAHRWEASQAINQLTEIHLYSQL